MIEPFPHPKVKQPRDKKPGVWILTPEQEEWLRRWHPCTENKVLEKMSGFSHSTLARFIRELGLRKEGEGLKEIWRRKAEARKDLIRKEKRRVLYGLTKHTKLYTPLTPFNCAQLSCRMHAVEKGYVLSADYKEGSPDRWVIFYDEDTPRDEVFERNCNKNGFKVKDWNYG